MRRHARAISAGSTSPHAASTASRTAAIPIESRMRAGVFKAAVRAERSRGSVGGAERARRESHSTAPDAPFDVVETGSLELDV